VEETQLFSGRLKHDWTWLADAKRFHTGGRFEHRNDCSATGTHSPLRWAVRIHVGRYLDNQSKILPILIFQSDYMHNPKKTVVRNPQAIPAAELAKSFGTSQSLSAKALAASATGFGVGLFASCGTS